MIRPSFILIVVVMVMMAVVVGFSVISRSIWVAIIAFLNDIVCMVMMMMAMGG